MSRESLENVEISEFYEMMDAIMLGIDEGRTELSYFNDAGSDFHSYLWNIDKNKTDELAAKAFVSLSRFIALRGEMEKSLATFCFENLMKDVKDGKIDCHKMKDNIIKYGALIKRK